MPRKDKARRIGHTKFFAAADLETTIPNAIHEGRIVLVGKNQRKRILHEGERGALYVKMNGDRWYLTSISRVVLTNGIRDC